MSDRNRIRLAGLALALPLILPLTLGGCDIVGDVASSTVSGVADGTKTVVSWFQGGSQQQAGTNQAAVQPAASTTAAMPPPAAAPATPVQSAPLAAPAPVQQEQLK